MAQNPGLTFDGDVDDVDERVINGHFEDVSDLERDIDGQINKIFSEFGGDDRDTEFKIHVKRVMPGKGELEHCFSCLPNELPITDRVKSDYGSGAYEVWIYKDGKIFKRRKMNIAQSIKKPVSVDENMQGISSIMQMMIQSQQEQMREIKQLVLESRNTHQIPQTNPTDNMGAMLGIMVQMKEFLGGQPQTNQMDTILEAVRLVKEIGGDSDGGKERNLMDGLVELGKTFGPPIIEMTKKAQENQLQNPQVYKANPIQSTEQGQIQRPANQKEGEQMNMFKFQLGMLVSKAAANSDPALYADLVLDNVAPEQIHQFVNRPDLMEYLVSIEPRIEQYKDWFMALRQEIISALTDNANDDDLTNESTPANTDNIIDVEKPGNSEISNDSDKAPT